MCPYVCGRSLCFPQVGVFITEISCLTLDGINSFCTAGQTRLCLAQMGKQQPYLRKALPPNQTRRAGGAAIAQGLLGFVRSPREKQSASRPGEGKGTHRAT